MSLSRSKEHYQRLTSHSFAGCYTRPATVLVRKTAVVRRTQTVTVTRRRLGARGQSREMDEVKESIDEAAEPEIEAVPLEREFGSHLTRRNLCPVFCPVGAALGKTSGGPVTFCCPRRSVVSRVSTVKKTSIIRKTVTKTLAITTKRATTTVSNRH